MLVGTLTALAMLLEKKIHKSPNFFGDTSSLIALVMESLTVR